MNREIKFRAWDEQWKVMYNNFQFYKTGDLQNDWIVFTCDNRNFESNWKDNPYFRSQLHIMQFTGLSDKNGKEIYEGDILKIFIGAEKFQKIQWTVTFEFGAFQLRTSTEKTPISFVFFAYSAISEDVIDTQEELLKYIEIIGNIYQNPELLTN